LLGQLSNLKTGGKLVAWVRLQNYPLTNRKLNRRPFSGRPLANC
jgi:hypothetical protein